MNKNKGASPREAKEKTLVELFGADANEEEKATFRKGFKAGRKYEKGDYDKLPQQESGSSFPRLEFHEEDFWDWIHNWDKERNPAKRGEPDRSKLTFDPSQLGTARWAYNLRAKRIREWAGCLADCLEMTWREIKKVHPNLLKLFMEKHSKNIEMELDVLEDLGAFKKRISRKDMRLRVSMAKWNSYKGEFVAGELRLLQGKMEVDGK